MIFVRGAIILEIIFAFASSNSSFLSYIQGLSLPLFLCFPIFIKEYNKIHIILALIYIICWILIFRIKFYSLLNPQPLKESKRRRSLSIFASAAFFLIIIFVSSLLSYRILLGKFEKEGFLPEESREAEAGSESLEKEYYALQDKVQEGVAGLIPDFDSKEVRLDMLILLEALIKETSSLAEVKKAHLGLISRLRTPGPGLEIEKAEAVIILMEKYLDKKIAFNIKSHKDRITDTLKKNKFKAMEKISVLNRINKIENSYSAPEINKYEKELKNITANPKTKDGAKRELRKLIEGFKEWKTFEAYRKRLIFLNKGVKTLDSQLKKEASDLILGIDSIENLPGLKKAEDINRKLKETSGAAGKDIIKGIAELLDLKSEMLLIERGKGIKRNIDGLSLLQDEKQELKDKISDIEGARDSQEFLKSLAGYREKTEENRVKIDSEIKGLLEVKAHVIFNEKEEEIKDALKENNLPDKGQDFVMNLEKLELERNSERLTSDANKLKEDIEKFSSQGFISIAAKDTLIKELEEIKNIFQAELEAEKEGSRKDGYGKAWQLDYRDGPEDLIEKLPLKKERKEALKHLSKELFRAEKVSQAENIKKAIDTEIEKLYKDQVKKEEVRRVKEAFDSLFKIKKMFIIEKLFASLRGKIEDLKLVNPQEAERIQRYLEKIRYSHSNEELQKNIDAFKEYFDSRKQLAQGQAFGSEEIIETGDLEINIMPSYLVIPIGSSVSLRAVAIYNKLFVKELGSGLDWFSSEPHVAWIDEKGIVHSLANGEAQIHANYAGRDSQKMQVIVVDRINEQIDATIGNELVR